MRLDDRKNSLHRVKLTDGTYIDHEFVAVNIICTRHYKTASNVEGAANANDYDKITQTTATISKEIFDDKACD